MRRTKILATIGPASREPAVLDQLFAAGLDAVRLNFSHGSREDHAENYRRVRDAARRAGRPVAILQDLQGPKIRIGKVKGTMQVPTGSELVITTRPMEGEGNTVSTEYAALIQDVTRGDRILLDEGRLTVRVREVREDAIHCDVEDGGVLTSNKGINVPGAALTASAMTDKDKEHARFGLELGVDFMALSFVRRPRDIEELRALMRDVGRVVPIIAKIEKPQAVDAIDELAVAADGLMVARGDLGIEVPLEMIPAYQKRIIARANFHGKLVITATQMLESMTDNPIPTRAEVTDVANSVLDGTDAVMLSGETAVGKYPVDAVRRMASIVEAAETHLFKFDNALSGATAEASGFTNVICRVAAIASREADAKAIVVFTDSGQSAARLSDERPKAPIVAITAHEPVKNRLALYWGVQPHLYPEPAKTLHDMLARGQAVILENRVCELGDPIVFLLGSHLDPDAAHSVRVARLGE